MEVVVIILVVLSSALSFIVYNLLRKVERYEDAVSRYDKGMVRLAKVISSSTDNLKELDVRGHFQVDDELGQFFNAMKEAQQEINDTFLDIEENA